MDGMTFVAALVRALAWPVAIIVCLIILRRPFQVLLGGLKSIKYQDLELSFDRQLSALRATAAAALPAPTHEQPWSEQMKQLVFTSSEVAILETWRRVENKIIDLARQKNLEAAPAVWVMPLVLGAFLLKEGHLSDVQYATFRDLKYLRDAIAHARSYAISASEALDYVDIAARLLNSLDGTGQ
jgi:hypothetical protein